MRLCAACAGASSTHVCSAQYLQPPPYVPRVSARHLLCPSLAFPTSFCHLCLRKVSCALPQHVISSSLPLASMCAVYNIPSRTHTEPAPQCRDVAQHLGRINNCAWLCPACAGASSIHVCSARYLQPPPFLPCVSARHLLYPSLAFHARCPTLGASFYCLHALMPFVSARHSVALCLGFPTLAR